MSNLNSVIYDVKIIESGKFLEIYKYPRYRYIKNDDLVETEFDREIVNLQEKYNNKTIEEKNEIINERNKLKKLLTDKEKQKRKDKSINQTKANLRRIINANLLRQDIYKEKPKFLTLTYDGKIDRNKDKIHDIDEALKDLKVFIKKLRRKHINSLIKYVCVGFVK